MNLRKGVNNTVPQKRIPKRRDPHNRELIIEFVNRNQPPPSFDSIGETEERGEMGGGRGAGGLLFADLQIEASVGVGSDLRRSPAFLLPLLIFEASVPSSLYPRAPPLYLPFLLLPRPHPTMHATSPKRGSRGLLRGCRWLFVAVYVGGCFLPL